jgi:hypothetical protein
MCERSKYTEILVVQNLRKEETGGIAKENAVSLVGFENFLSYKF